LGYQDNSGPLPGPEPRGARRREELGDDARHASERYKLPKDPMSLDEAKAFVKSLAEAWIRTL
jgi:hypothetical protein